MQRQHLTITVSGKDRSGVIAGFTSYIYENKGNIEQLVEQVQRNYFQMTLLSSFTPEHFHREKLSGGIEALGQKLGMDTRLRFSAPSGKARMALFVTREPHCADHIMAALKSGALKCQPVIMVSNHKEMEAMAKRFKLPFLHADFTDHAAAETKILKALDEANVDFIVLARFMKILSPRFCWNFPSRIINIHPSLLPAFPGAGGYRQAHDAGVKVVGVTSHFVTADLDRGPVICQDVIRLKPNEALPSIIARGQKLESKVLLKAVKLYLSKKLDVHWGKVWQV
jgi:formyltetrahydrofolate deformylase